MNRSRRRLVGIVGVLAALVTVGFGIAGAGTGFVIDGSSAAPIRPAALSLALVAGFLVVLSAVGSRDGGWVDTPYW